MNIWYIQITEERNKGISLNWQAKSDNSKNGEECGENFFFLKNKTHKEIYHIHGKKILERCQFPLNWAIELRYSRTNSCVTFIKIGQ